MLVRVPVQLLSTFRAEWYVFALNKALTAGTYSVSGKGAGIEGLSPEMGFFQWKSVGKLLFGGGKAQQFIWHSFEANA